MIPLSAWCWWCFILLVLVQQRSCSVTISQQKLMGQFQAKLQEFAAYAAGTTPINNNNAAWSLFRKNGRVFHPIEYGADPTGVQESSDAILKALHDASHQVQNNPELLAGIIDLGGVVIDLQGGNYKISKPIKFPPGVGNILVQRGTLRASNSFPGDRHLIELWSPDSGKHGEKVYYEDITFRDILFDSSCRGGGIFILDSVRIHITNCFFIHFTTQGILVRKGHETFISSCFLGQHPTVGGDKKEKYFSGTAIDLASNDNAITEVAIFSAAIGVLIRGEANTVTGVHCYNKASVYGGIGILVKLGASLTRIINCYLDYTGIVIEDPLQVHVSNGLFIGNANVVLRSMRGKVFGLNIVDNMFKGEPSSNSIVELDGNFTIIDQVVIDRNSVENMILKSTAAKLTVAGNGTRWVADFSSTLPFSNRINHFQYSFYLIQGLPSGHLVHAVTDVSNNIVVVESNKVVNAVITVEVDQHNTAGERTYI